MTTRLEILAQQGAKLSLAITLDPGESLVGRALRMQVRKYPGDSVVQLVASSTDERLLVTGARTMQLEVDSAVMAALLVSEPVELWSYDIQSFTNDPDMVREAEGVFRVSRATTRDTELEPAPTVSGFVSATIPQTWTADQQQIARLNIGILDGGGGGGGGEGVSDHGALTGLGDDDHTQYHNDARGDARYALIAAPAAAVAAHAAELDPHPTYTTAAEAAAAAPVQSVAGRTGAVVIAVADVSGAESTANKAQPSGYASLDSGGKVPQAQLPALAITEYLGDVASQAAMLALSGQKGDWCTRSDSPGTWIITGTDPTLLGSWTQIVHPTDAVTSVAGRTGAITISTSDVSGLGTAATHNVPASGNAASGEVVKGSDTRLSDSRAPTAHATNHAPGGSDALPWTTIHGRGLASARPAAASTNAGYIYYSTDTQVLERSTGSAWESISPASGGLSEPLSTLRHTRQSSALSAASAGETKFQFRDIARAGLLACKTDISDELILFPPLTHPFLTGAWYASGTGALPTKGCNSAVFGTGTASTVLNSINAVNIVTAASAGQEAIWYSNQFIGRDGSAAGDGYLMWGFIGFPDASYGSGATGSVCRMGMYASGGIGTSGARPSGRCAILEYSTVQSDANWQLIVHNGTNNDVVDTGLAFSAQAVYFYMIHSPRGGSSTYAYISDLTNGTSGSASTARNTGSTALGRYAGVLTRDTVARNVRFHSQFVLVGGQI